MEAEGQMNRQVLDQKIRNRPSSSTKTTFKPIPKYLEQFIVKQNYDEYTPVDHATWRFIMRVSKDYFKTNAHKKYLKGLEETGISIDWIPRIEEMNEKLMRFGWRAVAVSGFIPPAAFMEFQSLGVLPIACDMRKLEHLAYTPAPDIVHEAAGHAPIIADPEYAQYLLNYGEVSRKAIFSDQDMKIYQCIRNLSEVKEDPKTSESDIQKAQAELDEALAGADYVSEASYLARMNWWTVEYGLVGPIDQPKIYGAGLLSSVGESQSCLKEDVKKVPLSIDCLNTSYDITRPQPQLFVAPDFNVLNDVLEEMADQMAFRRGGLEGLAKAMRAQSVTTAELNTGVQISGKLIKMISDENNQPAYLVYEGPTQLSCQNQEIKNQGCERHAQGYSTPIGYLKDSHQSVTDLTREDLENLGFKKGQLGKLEFESGIVVEGEKIHEMEFDQKRLILTLAHCTVSKGSQILFQPEWGEFDLVCGTFIQSVFGGAADRGAYLRATGGFTGAQSREQKSNYKKEEEPLYSLYAQVRSMREKGDATAEKAESILNQLDTIQSDDWLLRVEILELCHHYQWKTGWCDKTQEKLKTISKKNETIGFLIQKGLEAIENET